MENAIILYPSPEIGHLISLLELGQFMLTHHEGFAIHVVLPAAPAAAEEATASYIAGVLSSRAAIKFHRLAEPPPSPPSKDLGLEQGSLTAIGSSNPLLHQALVAISKTHTIRAIVLDILCTCALPVAAGLNIPAYSYFTSGAGSFLPFLYFQTLHSCTDKSFKELGETLVHVPGAPPVAARDLPSPFQDRFGQPFMYRFFLDMSASLPRMSGVFVNSFEALEPRAIRAVREGTCVPIGPTPPLYCVGPLLASVERNEDDAVPECVTWLDSQPARSVLFLCFGSRGMFSRKQLKEIATGLERSGHRFLWVVRDPPDDRSSSTLEALFPEGFLERTKERGFVVKSWAPQVLVLNHRAVGGFVTHCGWNSVLEAIRGGVPMVAWPLYAEQRFNRVLMVEEMKVAVPMEEGEDGLVGWDEVEKRTREIMGSSEVGELVREKVGEFREAAMVALAPGGSSLSNLERFVSSWKP